MTIEFTIDTPDAVEAPDQPTKLRASLEVDNDGTLSLCMWESRDTTPWDILHLYTDGTYARAGCLPKDLGFQVDDGGHIKERSE